MDDQKEMVGNQKVDDSSFDSKKEVRARQSVGLLNFFIGDVVTSVQVIWNIEKIYGTGQSASCVKRMCLSHLILTVYKWTEFYDRFKEIIPEDCRVVSKTLVKNIERREIKSFRDRFIGHIWDRRKNRPLDEDEIISCVNTITGGDEDSFLRWCNNPDDKSSPTVVSVIERVRDRIKEEYDV